jgi:iron complex outermembrane recepter protein
MQFRRTEVAVAAGIAAVGVAPALAQDLRISVTGTNIKRADVETAAPIETITRDDILASGLQTISDVVRQITANNNGSISPSFTNGLAASGSALSLRGLGASNTLVLVNGRRMANFGLADDGHASFVDLQQIPFDAVERIEILKDGASAIYGSDAVAGVVNVILRQQFTGVTAMASAGTTSNGEGNEWRAAITGGMGDLTRDRYNAYVTLDFQRQDANPMNRGKAYIGSNNLTFMGLPDTRLGDPTDPWAPFANNALGNVRPVDPVTGALKGGPFQSLPGTCEPVNQSHGFCRFEGKDFRDIQPAIDRFNVFVRGTYGVTDGIDAYAELSYFQVKTTTRFAPTPANSTWYNPATGGTVTSNGIFLPVGHPDNPFNAQNLGARLFYTDAALGGRDADYDTGTQRYLLGVKGMTSDWDWDVAGLYIRSDTEINRKNLYSYDRLRQGFAGTGPYGYYRIGANAYLNDPAIYAWIAPDRAYSVRSENAIFDVKGSKDLMKLAGGQLALAVGYEFRREAIDNPGVPGTDIGNVVGLGYAAANGRRNVNAVYAELYAPISRNFEGTVAFRYDDYSDFGGTWNPKVGVKWTVLPSLVLRGTYATAFRAPGLYESGNSAAAAGLTLAVDTVRCPATGLPTDCGAAVMAINIGSPGIKPETAESWTAGVIWEPIPGLSGTIDYWSFNTRNSITIGSVQAVLDNPSAFPYALIRRDSNDLPGIPNSGTLLSVSTPYQNALSVKTDGIDVDVVWRQSLKHWGTLTTQFQWTHVFSYEQTFANGLSYEYVGTQGNYEVSSGSATPADRINLIIGWQRGPWNVTGTVRYVSDYTETPYQNVVIPDECLSRLSSATCHVSSFTTLDLSASYTGFRNWQIFGSIINVFDRIAPFNPAAAYGNTNYNFNYAYSGATGTQFNLGVRYTFD